MTVATDDERRRAAAALRTCILGREFRDRNDAMATLLESVSMAVGLTPAHDPTMQDLCDRLAGLIEPTCDREALLALADKVVADTEEDIRSEDVVPAYYAGECLRDVAHRIRELCGVTR